MPNTEKLNYSFTNIFIAQAKEDDFFKMKLIPVDFNSYIYLLCIEMAETT